MKNNKSRVTWEGESHMMCTEGASRKAYVSCQIGDNLIVDLDVPPCGCTALMYRNQLGAFLGHDDGELRAEVERRTKQGELVFAQVTGISRDIIIAFLTGTSKVLVLRVWTERDEGEEEAKCSTKTPIAKNNLVKEDA